MHKPCITVGEYACEPGSDLFNLLLSKKVDLVLSGHEHTYQRSHQLALARRAARPSCRAATTRPVSIDSDSAFTQGAGSVAMVVGTGGNSLYNVNAADAEAPLLRRHRRPEQERSVSGSLDVDATDDYVAGVVRPRRRRHLQRLVHHHARHRAERAAGRLVHLLLHRPDLLIQRLRVHRLRRHHRQLRLGLR